ncbi:hypothetical protein GCM10007424_10570 [Flavobacterium suaedae]|uniref:Outer membrane protein beta-barrel domain-containing protein n=1 Tax=Flavobacterium suaedae TaxID=1767027 RepID=A0ABQ1JM39_9FLAO|nr:hypothetical protein [Flavobacterium suaedae]GGB72515.1 hypothetical protein GCM10007424_10570 [Flavobacterium suaedae]
MIRKLTFIAMLIVVNFGYSQSKFDQYSLEAGYGMAASGDPSISGFTHFDAGFRYMVDEYWGIKFDFGLDQFRTGSNPELGTDYKRFSVQGVYNLGRTLDLPNMTNGYINALAHGGLGYSSLKSINRNGVDNIGNVIIGITPQVYISDNFAFMMDASFILNFTQHYNFAGEYPDGSPTDNAFTGKMFNLSFGLTYYFGRNSSDVDWR